jgi:N-acyl-D-amino-acid deacylase
LSLKVLFVIALAVASLNLSSADFDLVITRGRIVDGTGNPWFLGDLAIKNGRVVEIGRIDPARATRAVDASGLIVAPGFIDVHTHIEGGIASFPAAENFLRMGVTSVVTGNCGGSILRLDEWFTGLESTGISINVASLVGHNAVRRSGMNGEFDRAPTTEELARMQELVARAMKEGAVGLSTGLEYIPGTFAKTDEIVALAKVAAQYGGVYATHMRNEGLAVEDSIREALEVGAQSGCPVEISHFKISSKKRWGASTASIKLVTDARARGQQVTVDQYLYPAASTGIGILFPSSLFEGGNDKAKERIADPETRARVVREVLAKAKADGFSDLSFAFIASYRANPAFNGKNLQEIARTVRGKDRSEDQAEQAIDILLAGGAQLVLQKMSEADVERIIRQPFTMVASDAGVIDIAGDGVPHPRGFGNNARLLAIYVREKKLVGLEEAVRKMSSLPAQTFRLWDRGILRPGMAADVVIFDERTIADRATFQQPKQFPAGIEYVIVNGQVVIEKGSHTGAKPGRALRGNVGM